MKHLAALLLLAPLACLGQARKPTPAKKPATKTATAIRQSPELLGLGQFHINQTTPAIIDQLCKELGTHLQHVKTQERVYELADSLAVCQIEYSSIIDGGPSDAEPCIQTRVYLLPRYEVAGIKLTNVYLKFYNNLLYRIDVDSPEELADAFAVKYGKPINKVVSQPVPCVYTNTGNKVTYHSETGTQDWYNGDIKAEYMLLKHYDSNCKELYSSHFFIFSKTQDAAEHKCAVAAYKAADTKQNQVRRRQLSDL